jgi:hypothetical protein
MEKIVKQGKLLFGVAVAALGAENLICAHVSQPVFAKSAPAIPVLPFVPAIPLLAYLVGLVLLAAGLSIAANIPLRFAAILLGFFLLLCALVLFVPKAVASPRDLNIRTCLFEELALGASALTLASCLRVEERSSTGADAVLDKLLASGPYLFALSSIVFGVTHFLILRFIASLVLAWIPGGLFWAYLTGSAFIAAGISIATGVMARWGVFWLGIMFLLCVGKCAEERGFLPGMRSRAVAVKFKVSIQSMNEACLRLTCRSPSG